MASGEDEFDTLLEGLVSMGKGREGFCHLCFGVAFLIYFCVVFLLFILFSLIYFFLLL